MRGRVVRGIVVAVVLLMCRAICGVTIVVSPSGQIANITAASKIARPGDVIELMAGTYTAKEQIYKLYGTRDMPITIRAGADGGVVFDGSSLTLSGSTPILSFYQVGYLAVQGPIEIRSSSGNGMNVLNGTHMEICNLTIHETQKWALATSGVDIHIHHNEMYRCVLENEDGKSTHGWSQCVASWAIDSAANTLSSGVLWEFNTIHDTWGEGLDLIQCDGCTARDNTVYDSWSVLLYSDNVRNILIERNVLYCTSDEHNRNGNRPTMLLIGTESWPTHPIPTVNLTIRNNLGIGGGNGIAYYGEENYYSEIKAYYNTFWNTTGAGVYFPENPTQGISSGNELRNNVFYISNKWWAGEIEDIDAWLISCNAWLSIDDIPLTDSTGYTNTSFAIPKSSCNATAIFSALCTPESFQSISPPASPECFIPNDYSVLTYSGLPISSIKQDFFLCGRDTHNPTIGFAESPTCVSATPKLLPPLSPITLAAVLIASLALFAPALDL